MPRPPDPRRTHLAGLLASHLPSDDEEAGFLVRMRALLEVPGDPFDRDHYAPGHFTASSFILSPDASSLLLIFHDKLERWLQPGGHVDPGDADICAAAMREVSEEVGLGDGDVHFEDGRIFDVDVHGIPARKQAPAHHHFDVRFALRARSANFQAGSDARAGRWMSLSDIDIETSDRSVMRAVQKLLDQ